MEQDFPKTGDQLTKTGPMRLGSVLTFPGPSKTSGITGFQKQVLPPARPIGAALGVSGPDELLTIYDNQPGQGRVVVSVLTLLKPASLQLHGSGKSANLQVISDCKAALESALKPQEPERLSASITTFLAHWFLPDMTATIRSAMIGDWLDEFDDVPGWALDFALKRYFAVSKKKPFPVDIKALVPPEVKWGREMLNDLNSRYL